MTASVTRVTVTELCEREGVSQTVVVRLVEHDIARPIAGSSAEDWVFDATGAQWVYKAVRLHRDLELDWVAVSMLVDLLRQREKLDRENRRLKQRLARFLTQD
jgi:chaperone modulatory protein CbpM